MSEADAYSRLAGVYDEIVVDPCYPLWADFLEGLWATDEQGVSEVLDLCCGTGLMDAELVDRGFRVLGVDASQEMLDRARALLGPGIALLRQTLPHLSVDDVFDAVISTMDGLNYLPPEDFSASVARIAPRLRARGWLVFDLHTDAMLDFAAANPLIDGSDSGSRFVLENTVDHVHRTCDSRITVTRESDGDTFVENHRQYFHGDDHVRAALDAAGFVDVEVFDEYTPERAGEATLRATWVARTPAAATAAH